MQLVSNTLSAVIISIGMLIISKKLLKRDLDKPFIIVLLVVLAFSFVIFLSDGISYAPLEIFVMFLLIALCSKTLFDINIQETLGLSIIVILLVLSSKTALYIGLNFIKNAIRISNEPIPSIITNLFIMVFSYFLANIKFIRQTTDIFIKKLEYDNNKFEYVIITFLLIMTLFFYYQLFSTRYIEGNSTNFLIYIIALTILSFIYMYEKIRYKDLTKRYDSLFEYACTFEEELDRDKLIRHEYKNQLAVIKDMSNDEEVIEYIKDILKHLKDDEEYIKYVKNLPKGGLRGIVYYKINVMKHKNINFSLDVNKTVKKKLSLLKEDEIKFVSYIVGVCSDNAIEEVMGDDDSNISIEIYDIKDEIDIIISNSIAKNIDLNKIGKRGYSTKGHGHGNGLFMINRMINNHPNITMNSKVINNYFIQEIKINIER